MISNGSDSLLLSMYRQAIQNFSSHKLTDSNVFEVKTIDQLSEYMKMRVDRVKQSVKKGSLVKSNRDDFDNAGACLDVTGKVYARRVDALHEQATRMVSSFAGVTKTDPVKTIQSLGYDTIQSICEDPLEIIPAQVEEPVARQRYKPRNKTKKTYLALNTDKINLKIDRSTFAPRIDVISQLFIFGDQNMLFGRDQKSSDLLIHNYSVETSYGGHFLMPEFGSADGWFKSPFADNSVDDFEKAVICEPLENYLDTKNPNDLIPLLNPITQNKISEIVDIDVGADQFDFDNLICDNMVTEEANDAVADSGGGPETSSIHSTHNWNSRPKSCVLSEKSTSSQPIDAQTKTKKREKVNKLKKVSSEDVIGFDFTSETTKAILESFKKFKTIRNVRIGCSLENTFADDLIRLHHSHFFEYSDLSKWFLTDDPLITDDSLVDFNISDLDISEEVHFNLSFSDEDTLGEQDHGVPFAATGFHPVADFTMIDPCHQDGIYGATQSKDQRNALRLADMHNAQHADLGKMKRKLKLALSKKLNEGFKAISFADLYAMTNPSNDYEELVKCWPVALFALLQLANQYGLKLNQVHDLRDIEIMPSSTSEISLSKAEAEKSKNVSKSYRI
ncbi:hypothetical protein ACOME3_009644 [Neoechinorhynchus agilis]